MTYDSEVAADSPLCYWRLNGGAGTDSSGNGRDATTNNTLPSGATGLLVGDADGAGSFNGTTQNLVAAYAAWMDVSSAWSVDFLLNTTQTSVGFLVARDSSSNRLWQIGINASGFAGKLYVTRVLNASDVVSVVTTTSTMSVNDGVTRHVGITYDGTTLRLYINGALDASSAWTGGLSSRHPNLTVGYYYSGSGYAFAGVLDEIAYYGSALSSTRVAAHYAASVGGGGVTGTLAATLAGATLAASGTETFSGTLAATTGDATLAASGTVANPITGTFAATLPVPTTSFTGTYAAPPTGSLAATLTVPAVDLTGTYAPPPNPTGSFAATLPVPAVDFTGGYTPPAQTGTFAATLPVPSPDFTGTYTPAPITGTFGASLPVPVVDFAGLSGDIFGSFAVTLPPPVVALSGSYGGPYPTDTSNLFDGLDMVCVGIVTKTAPAVTPPTNMGVKQDKALAYPLPVMVNGRPT